MMYARSNPMPGDEKGDSDTAPLYDDRKDACNPDNFKDEEFDEDEIIVKAK